MDKRETIICIIFMCTYVHRQKLWLQAADDMGDYCDKEYDWLRKRRTGK